MDSLLHIEPREIYPKVLFDKNNGIFEISGRSLPEDVDSFFTPVLAWLEAYAADPNEYTEFIFNFDYYNSSTVRKIVDILSLLEQIIKGKGKQVQVKWFYEDGDDVMHDNGEDFKNVIKIPIELISYTL